MVRTRVRVLIAFLSIPFLVLIGRLAGLQVFQDIRSLRSRAEGDHRRITSLPPTRGSILDRSGRVLALDIASFDLEFTLFGLNPRERYLPVIEKALNLCDDTCPQECPGHVLRRRIGEIIDAGGSDVLLNEAPASEEGPILVAAIPQQILNVLGRELGKYPLYSSLKTMDKTLGIYSIQSAEKGLWDLRMRIRETLVLEATLLRISRMTGNAYADLKERVDKAESGVAFTSNISEKYALRRKVRLLTRNVATTVVTEVEYHPDWYPGLTIASHHQRSYPYGEIAAAVTGSLRPPSPAELEDGFAFMESLGARRPSGVRDSSCWIGDHGLEEFYDDRLRGAFGHLVEEIDRRQVARETIDRILPDRGDDIQCTMDLDLQKLLYETLEGLCQPKGMARSGAAVVMDLTGHRAPGGTGPPGAILASVGWPESNPDLLRSEAYREELNQREKDFKQGILFNYSRPVRYCQPPGSVFKLVVAAAALENGVEWPKNDRRAAPVNAPLHPETTFCCFSSLKVPGFRTLDCLGYHEDVNLLQAIEKSCNVYFYHLGGDRLQPRTLHHWAMLMGFGRSTGIDLDDPQRPAHRALGVLKDQVGRQEEMCVYAIGTHGYVEASVLQVTRAIAGIALGGAQLPTPYLVTPQPPENLGMKPGTARLLQEGMRRVVHETGGTAHDPRYDLTRFKVAIKTGTAELIKGDRKALDPALQPLNSAWIAGYVPYDRPEIAFAILLERVNYHGSEAAPVLVRILEHFAASEPEKYLMKPEAAPAGPPAAPPDNPASGERGEQGQ